MSCAVVGGIIVLVLALGAWVFSGFGGGVWQQVSTGSGARYLWLGVAGVVWLVWRWLRER